MAECEPKDQRPGDCNVGEDDADHVGGDDHVGSRTRQKKSRESMVTRKPTGRDIDDMKIIDLKSALRQLKLSTTGSKSELKVRLREARGRKRSIAMAADCDDGAATACEDDATNNEETTDESASDDDSDDQTETEQNDEKNRKKRDEKKNVRRSEVMQPRRRTRARDRTVRGECSDDDESSNNNDTDYEEEDRRRNRRAARNAHRRDEYSQPGFTIRDVEDSLTHFSGDDKLPIDKWIAEFEDMGDMLRWNELQMLIYGRRMLKIRQTVRVVRERNHVMECSQASVEKRVHRQSEQRGGAQPIIPA